MRLYNCAKGFFNFIFTCFSRWQVTGRENIPQTGPLVIVCNHISLWDPVAVAVAVNRQVFFMAKEELFHYPVFGRLLRIVGAFPVKRGQSDREAIKKSLEILKRGQVLGVFPEGHRMYSDKLGEFQEGAVHLAIKRNAYILPVGVVGTRGMFRKGWFHPFTVNIGQPMLAKNTENEGNADFAKELNEKIRQEVALLSGNQK